VLNKMVSSDANAARKVRLAHLNTPSVDCSSVGA